MSLRKITPCDFGPCPYGAELSYTCEYFCVEPEPDDDYDDYDDCDYDIGYDPYVGGFTDDC